MADDTQQREADEREYEDDFDDPDDPDDLDALEVGADDGDASTPEADADQDDASAGAEDDDVVTLDDDELQQASLEQLRDQRTARKRLDLDDDEDLLALVSDAGEPDAEATPSRVTPIKSRQEFVCARCRLVKPRVQLADPSRGLCRDCA